jgi:hypothetical protein
MGGYGSGRRFDSKTTTSYYRKLDIRRFQRDGVLRPGCTFMWQWSREGEVVASIQVCSEQNRVWLFYHHRRNDGPWKNEDYPVTVEWTRCNYGGARAWFRCPASGCGRRVAILYGGEIFACRHCYQLAYDSQREAPHHRAVTRAQAIRRKLGGTVSLFERFPEKPKGMHWSTYQRLRMKAVEAQNRSWPPWFLEHMLRHTHRSKAVK